MENKRYQVFVSSTYSDLINERAVVMQTLMKMDCIPAGMEHFPAADEEQWTFIKRIIDHSDYYLLIVGGRYGSLDSDGISFTEKEYDYAVSKNIKVIALLHEKPENLTLQNSEQNPELREKLVRFREKIKTKRLVSFWNHANELPGMVALNVMNAYTTFPAVGWVRADKVTSESTLLEMNELRKENSELLALNKKLEKKISDDLEANDLAIQLANIETEFEFKFFETVSTRSSQGSKDCMREVSLTWIEIFSYISPLMTSSINHKAINKAIATLGQNKLGTKGKIPYVETQDFFTISIQFQAYGLIKVDLLPVLNGKGAQSHFWKLTEKGKKLMTELRVVR